MSIFNATEIDEIIMAKENLEDYLQTLPPKTRDHFYKAFDDVSVLDITEKAVKAKMSYWSKKLNIGIDDIFCWLW